MSLVSAMSHSIMSVIRERHAILSQAVADFFYLQNHHYPRASSLDWVGNRYQLKHFERQFLNRGVFSQAVALRRRAKECISSDYRGEWLIVDGHNVQITLESAILERPLLIGNDRALRDVAAQSAKFRVSEVSHAAMVLVFNFLQEFRPGRVLFLFDAPMSHSGLLAEKYRDRLETIGLPGHARTSPVPEREIPYDAAVVASSDREILDKARKWFDLARSILMHAGLLKVTANFSSFMTQHMSDQRVGPDIFR